MIRHGKYQGNSKTNEKYPGYHENHKCYVYDLFRETSQRKAEVRADRTVFLYAPVRNCKIFTTNRYFDQREQISDNEKKRGYIVITADKGLAGAYNHNVIKMAQELFSQGENNKLFVVGELGRQYFAKEGLEVDAEFKYTVQNPSLHRARVIADYVMDLYVNGELDEVYLVYTKMENSFSMNAEKQKLLPLAKEDFIHPAPADIYQEEIKVESSMEEILEHVVPNCVTGYIYGALVESFASEHNSRMMAMQTSTDSARSMISQLSIEYNRVRQAAITQQITEVIGGAKAQKNKKKK